MRFGTLLPTPGTALARLLALALPLALGSCGDGGPALQVGDVEFAEEDLLGLSADRQNQLVALAALGLVFAGDEAEAAGAPLLDRRREDLLLDRFSANLVLESAGVEEDVLRAQYRTNPRPELVVRHVVALAEEGAADSVHRAARTTAEEALERVNAGEPMAEVAADLSEEPGAADRGGRLQPGRRGSWVPEFWQAASSLEEGENTGVVQTQYGYHVIQLEERRIVPFDEVRSDVVLQAGRMLGDTEGAWARWTDSLSASIELDTAAIRGAVEAGALDLSSLAFTATGGASTEGAGGSEGSGMGEDGEAESADAPDAPSTVLAAWEPQSSGAPESSGRYVLDDFRRHLASLEKEQWRRVTEDPPETVMAEIRRDALRKRAGQEAEARGLRLSRGPLERTAREWSDQVAAWAVPLGFQAGATPAAVRSQALAALSTTRQNASIARRELESREPLLRAAYPVRVAPDA